MATFDSFQKYSFPLNYISHRNIYLLGLAVILCGLTWANFLMSLGQLILLGNWILEGNFKVKWAKIKSSRLIQVLLSLFALHLLALLWTIDFSYAFHDLNIKLPLLALPILIGTTNRLNTGEWQKLLLVYLSTCFLVSLVSWSKYAGLGDELIYDKRDLSVNISHIRYGLNLCLAIFLCLFYYKSYSRPLQIALILLPVWWILCLILFELSTGLFCLISLAVVGLMHRFWFTKSSGKLRLGIGIILFGFASLSFSELLNIREAYYHKTELNYNQDHLIASSPSGASYYYNIESSLQENGVYLWRFIVQEELEQEWSKRSDITLDSSDNKGQNIMNTLVRYLSAKGYKKDSTGVASLEEREITAIESGISNPYYLNHNPIQNRIYSIIYEFDHYRNHQQVNGFSLAMRLEYWKNAWHLIQKNWWIGVGTGDVKSELMAQYELDQSPLEATYRKRAHNQYLSIWVAFGLIGLLVFINFLLFPFLQFKGKHKFLFGLFLLLSCLSFITEDGLETQAGVSFFSLFNCLFLFALPKD